MRLWALALLASSCGAVAPHLEEATSRLEQAQTRHEADCAANSLRWRVTTALASIEPSESAPETKERAREALREIHRPRVRQALKDAEHRKGATEGTLSLLLYLGERSAERTAEAMLAGADPARRKIALSALGFASVHLRVEKATQILRRAFDDKRHPLRREIANCLVLAHESPSRKLEWVGRASSDPDVGVREEVARFVGRQADESPGLREALRRALRDPEPRVRFAAVRALERTRLPRLPPEFAALVEDEDRSVRDEALKRLAVRPSPEAAEALLRVAREGEAHEARSAALKALGRSRVLEAEPLLLAALGSGEAVVKKGALVGLRHLWDRHPIRGEEPLQGDMTAAVEAVRTMLKDKDQEVRVLATAALVAMGAAETFNDVLAIIRSAQGQHKRYLVWSLARARTPGAEPVLWKLYRDRGEPYWARECAGRRLRELGENPPGLGRIASATRWTRFRRRYAYPDNAYVGVSLAPWVVLRRTGVDLDLEGEPADAWELTLTARPEDVYFDLHLGYAGVREEDTGRLGHMYRVESRIADRYEVMRRAAARKEKGLCWAGAWGGSLLVLDLEGDDDDMIGLGAFARIGTGVLLWHNIGIEVYAQANGWLGADRDGFSAASAGTLGATVMCSF